MLCFYSTIFTPYLISNFTYLRINITELRMNSSKNINTTLYLKFGPVALNT